MGVRVRVGIGLDVWEAAGVDVLVGGKTVMVAEGVAEEGAVGAKLPS